MSQTVSPEKKKEIIARIRDEGKRVVDVANEYGVTTKSIYRWLREGVGGNTDTLKVARLQRELDAVYGILGRVTADLQRQKK